MGPKWPPGGPQGGPLLALPGGSRRVPGSLREVIFGAFFGGRRRDPDISAVLMILSFFSIQFLMSFLTIGCRPCGKAGASVHLEKTRFRSEGVEFGLSAFCAHGQKTHKKKQKKRREHRQQNTIKAAYATKTKKTLQITPPPN